MTELEQRLQDAIELARSKIDVLKKHPQQNLTIEALEQQIAFGQAVLTSGEPLEILPQCVTLEALAAMVKS